MLWFICGLSVPKVSVVINIETNQVELQPAAGEQSLQSVCVQQESDGRCQVGGCQGRSVTFSKPTVPDEMFLFALAAHIAHIDYMCIYRDGTGGTSRSTLLAPARVSR